MPVLLAGGIPLVSIGVNWSGLTLTGSHTSLSGVVSLNYEIQHPAG
jgi:hypothetical protein